MRSIFARDLERKMMADMDDAAQVYVVNRGVEGVPTREWAEVMGFGR